MKTVKLLAVMAVMIFMAMTLGCASVPGDPDNPINNNPPDTKTQVVEVSFIYDQTLATQAEAQTTPSSFVSMVADEIKSGLKTLAMAGGITPTAIIPDFPPTYVGIGGDAVISNPACRTDPYNVACRTDISASCSSGVCNVSIAIPVGTWRSLWFFYAGQIQVAHMSLTSTMSTPNQVWLNNFGTLSGDTMPATNPLHKTWPAACVKVDRPTTTTIEVNRNVAAQPNCQDILLQYELYDIGDSADNRLDDDLLVWTGVNTHDGDQKVKSTLLPPTVVSGSTLFPRLLWNVAATPQPAYTHRFASVTSGMAFWIAVYSHDRGLFALPGQISPIKGGVYVRTYRYDTATHTFQAAVACGGSGYGIELINMLNLNYLIPANDPFYVLQVQGTTPATSCPIQGADTRPVIFGYQT